MSTEDRPVYRLEIRSEPGQQVPEAVRLRSALKLLLRAFGFRCLVIREVESPMLGGRQVAHEKRLPAPPVTELAPDTRDES
jgi:hypothetical protein